MQPKRGMLENSDISGSLARVGEEGVVGLRETQQQWPLTRELQHLQLLEI